MPDSGGSELKANKLFRFGRTRKAFEYVQARREMEVPPSARVQPKNVYSQTCYNLKCVGLVSLEVVGKVLFRRRIPAMMKETNG